MSISMAKLFKQALDLDEKDRAALAGILISSLEAAPDEGLEEAWRAQVARRASQLDAGSVESVRWAPQKASLGYIPETNQKCRKKVEEK